MTASARLSALAIAAPLLAACATTPPPPPPPRPSPCEITACRPAKTIILQKDRSQFLLQTPAWPYVLDGIVIVRPGDDFFIAGDERDGALVNLRRIDPPAPGTPDVIHITYKQEQLNSGKFVMMLALQSSFPRPLVYRALGMHAMRPDEPFVASICPVRPGIQATEMWPEPIWQILLRNLRFSDGATACKVY